MPVNLNNINRGISTQAPVEEPKRNWLQSAGNWLSNSVLEPMDVLWGSAIAQATPWNMPGEQAWRERMANGEGWFQAGRETYRNDITPGYKVLAGLTNPLFYLPVAGWGAKAGQAIGGVARVAETAGQAGRAATGLSKISPALGTTVKAVTGAPFRVETAIGKGVEKLAKRTLNVTGVAGKSRAITTALDKRFVDRYMKKMEGLRPLEINLPKVAGEMTHDALYKALSPKPNLGTAIVRELGYWKGIGKPIRTTSNIINGRIFQDELSRHIGAEDLLFGHRGNNIVNIANDLQAVKIGDKVITNPRKLFGLGSEPMTSATAKENVFAQNVTLTPQGEAANASRYIGDVIEDYNKGWYALTPEQTAWIEKYHSIMDEWKALAKEHNVNLFDFEDVADNLHFYRLGTGKVDVETGKPVWFSGQGSPDKIRFYERQADGVANGVIYNADPVASAQATATWINKKIRDARLNDIMKPYATTDSKMAMEAMGNEYKNLIRSTSSSRVLLNKLKTGEKLTKSELAKIKELTGENLGVPVTPKASEDVSLLIKNYKTVDELLRGMEGNEGRRLVSNLTTEYDNPISQDFFEANYLSKYKGANGSITKKDYTKALQEFRDANPIYFPAEHLIEFSEQRLAAAPFPEYRFRAASKEEFESILKGGESGAFWTGSPSSGYAGENKVILVTKSRSSGLEKYIANREDNGVIRLDELTTAYGYNNSTHAWEKIYIGDKLAVENVLSGRKGAIELYRKSTIPEPPKFENPILAQDKLQKMYDQDLAGLKALTPEYRKLAKYYKGSKFTGTKLARIQDQPMFNGQIFPRSVAESYRVGRGLPSERAKKWIEFMNKPAGVSKVLRTAVASMDFSAPFIQGLPAMGADPIAWAKATASHYRWFFNQSNFSKVMTNPANKAVWEEASKYGLQMGKFEFYAGEEAIEKGMTQLGAKFGTTGAKIGRGIPRQTLGRGEAAFSGFGDIQRLELWKSLKYRAKTDEELYELAQSINKMTGYTDLIGVSNAQKTLEQTLIFAPRYMRAGFQLVGDIFQGGIRGELAREALGQMMTGGMMWYYRTCQALGQEPNLDPSSSKFLSVRIGDQWIGIGGFMTSLARFGADLVDYAANPTGIAMQAGETWDEYATRMRKDIPFLKFMYSKSAPLVGLATEFTTGTDYMGEEIETPAMWAKWLADKTLPMAMQSLVDEGIGAIASPGFAAQMGGLREFPISPKEKFYDKVNELSGGVAWKNLDKMQRRSLLLEHPELDEMKVKADSAFAIGVSGRVNQEWSNQQDSIEQQYDTRLQQIANTYEAGGYSAKQFRDAVGEAESNRRAAYKLLNDNPTFAGIKAALGDPERVNTDNQFDVALYNYRQLLWDNDELYDENGNYLYAKAEENKAEFNSKWPGMEAQIKQYIDLGRMGEPEAIADLRKARETMSPYFGIKDHLLAQAGLTKTYEAYGTWLNSHPLAETKDTNYLKDMLGLTPVLEQVSDYQKQVRESNGGQNIYNYYYMKYYS